MAKALTLFFKCLGTLPLWTVELDHGKGHWATVSLKGTSLCVRIFQVQAIQEGTGVSFLMASFTICGHSERDKTKPGSLIVREDGEQLMMELTFKVVEKEMFMICKLVQGRQGEDRRVCSERQDTWPGLYKAVMK